MLCGTPSVTPDLPGVRESIRVTGMGELVRPNDPAGTAAVLAKVMLNREQYTHARRDPHEIFQPERTFDAYERWYGELMAANPDGHSLRPSAVSSRAQRGNRSDAGRFD